MNKPEREPHYSKSVLTASERFQQAVKGNRAGRAVVNTVAGSSSPAYRQLIWHTADSHEGRPTTAHVEGDPHAGFVSRLWKMAAILAAPTKELEDLKDRDFSFPAPAVAQEAVAYVSEGVLHVGTKATQGYLFERYDDNDSAVAMRLGKGALDATMGVWLPDTRTFVGVSEPQVLVPRIPSGNLIHDYPGTVLV